MAHKTPSVKEPAPAYAAADNVVPPLSAEEKWAQGVIARWDEKFHGPGGDDVMMTEAEGKEYDHAVGVECLRRVNAGKMGINAGVPGDEFRRRLEESIKRDERLLAAGGGEDYGALRAEKPAG